LISKIILKRFNQYTKIGVYNEDINDESFCSFVLLTSRA